SRIRKTIYDYFPGWEKEYDDSSRPLIFREMTDLLKQESEVVPDRLLRFKDAVNSERMDK
ncbi:MAG: hypothetical protein K6F86_06445, partial [Lachnospiraceae bacterium]|nr:hypothetical protein [Lachnospiraceae bacterium]